MERRKFIERLFAGLALGGALLAAGCSGKEEERAPFGNQEPLWRLATGGEKADAPLEIAQTKDTPAMFRDASMGKEGANFTPKVEGG